MSWLANTVNPDVVLVARFGGWSLTAWYPVRSKPIWCQDVLDGEIQGLPFSCWGTKNSSNSDKRLGMPGGDKQSHWPKPSSLSPRAKCCSVWLTGDSCWRQPSLGIMPTGWTCSFASLKVMYPPGVRKNCKGHGALCISSLKVVVGAVLCRDWHLSTPLIFSQYLRKNLGNSLTSKYGCCDYWLHMAFCAYGAQGTSLHCNTRARTYLPRCSLIFYFLCLVSPQTTFENWISFLYCDFLQGWYTCLHWSNNKL